MRERLLKLIENRQKVVLIGVVIAVAAAALWINSAGPAPQGPPPDWTTSVPQGFLVVPLNLSNGRILARAIDRMAVVDLFRSGQQNAMAENLRVIKLSDEPVSFGAMIPEAMSGRLQPVFSGPGLTAAIRTSLAGPAKFHLVSVTKSLLRQVTTGE